MSSPKKPSGIPATFRGKHDMFTSIVNSARNRLDAKKSQKEELTRELLLKKQRLNDEQLRRENVSVLVNSCMTSMAQIHAQAQQAEATLLSKKQESAIKAEILARGDEERRQLRITFQHEVKKLSNQLTSAPELYHVDVISKDIDKLTIEFENVQNLLQGEHLPSIAKAELELQIEPVTTVLIEGMAPSELPATALEALIFKLKESAIGFEQGNEELNQEKIEIDKKIFFYQIK